MQAHLAVRRSRKHRERLYAFCVEQFFRLCILLSVLTMCGILYVLASEAFSFFGEVSFAEFFGSTDWTPRFVPQSFGVWPLVSGTLLVAIIAGAIAIPLGLAGAIFMSEYASNRFRKIAKPILEILAGVPTVVYGYFALLFVTPLIREVLPATSIFNALSAGIVMGIMILPLVVSFSEDAMLAVPRSLRLGAYALGATRLQVATRVVVPASLSGIGAAFILALARAIGETMIVTIAAGATPSLTLDPTRGIQTMTAYIAQSAFGEAPHGTIEYQTIFAVGILLFLMTLFLTTVSDIIIRRFREQYS